MSASFTSVLLASSVVFAIGCEGQIGERAFVDPDVRDPSDPFGGPDPVRPECDGVCIGETGLVRLSRDEWIAGVETAFGTEITVDRERLPADQSVGAFTSNGYSEISERDIAKFVDAAEEVAPQLADVLSVECGSAECGRAIFEGYAPALYRRPVESGEADAYAALYDWSYPEDGERLAKELVLETLLQSPHFLYRPERVPDGAPTLLNGNAIANRLSSFLWASPPDEGLLSRDLSTADDVEAAARAMLDDPRAVRGIGRFHREWLGIVDIPADRVLADAMRSETETFAYRVFQSADPTLRSLLTSNEAPIDAVLADHYEIAEGDWVSVPGRSGLLTQGAVMTSHGRANYTRAVHRGVFMRTEVLCQTLLEPPADALDDLPDVDEGALTDREQLALVTSGGDCEGCHRVINPAGFAFEHYDQLGRFRVQDDAGRAIDASGELVGAEDADGPFAGASELMSRLADSAIVGQCLTRQWFRYALGRTETEDDGVALFDAYQALATSDGNVRELIINLVRSDAFRHRRAPGEG